MKRPAPFSRHEYHRRIALLQAELANANLDAFLAFTSSWFRSPGAVRYCCGYDSIFGSAVFLLVPSRGEQHLLVNNFWDVIGRPEETERELQEFHLVDDLGEGVSNILAGEARRLGVVGERHMPAPIYVSLKAALPAVEMVDATPQLDAVREVKSDEELSWLRYNAALSDAAAQTFLTLCCAGISEKEVADEMLHSARKAGADRFWTPISVASGPRTALYYALPTERTMQPGDIVHMDCGAMSGGYHGDIQRALILPGERPARCDKLVGAVLAIQDHLVEAIRPGMTAGAVAELFAHLTDEAGFSDCLHPKARQGEVVVGHGIGSDGHESPALIVGNDKILRAGMVVTLEPMLFIPGVGGAGVEDMVLITADRGCRLTGAPRWHPAKEVHDEPNQ
jgi:Xaa-Pro aminopeptidase